MTSIGKQYYWVARHSRAMGRYGAICTVLAWHRSKALIRFKDGWEAITPGRTLRKLKPPSPKTQP